MARTYNKPGSVKSAPEKTIQKVQTASAFRPEKTAAVKEADIEGEEAPVQAEKKTAAKKETPAASVIAAPDEEVMQQIVYQPSAQILTRAAEPNESFGVGDDMPVYYL